MFKTILIVEDSKVQAMSLQYMLQSQGFKVLWACNGREGVQMAHIHLPDLIVMDIEMPELNGVEACRELQNDFVTQDIPIILLTSRTELDLVEAGLNAGARDYIPKDILSGPILLNTIESLSITEEV